MEIQSYFIASVEMRVRKKTQQRKQISGQKSSKKERGAFLARPGRCGEDEVSPIKSPPKK